LIALALAAVLLIGAIVGGYKYIRSTYDDTRKEGYDAGRSVERAEWQARESKELADANALILKLQDKNRKLERAAAAAAQQAAIDRRKGDEDDQAKKAAATDDVRANLERLCNARGADSPAAREETGRDATGAAPLAGPGVNAASRSGLLRATADFFTSEALRANSVARRLQQAQALIRTYLATCNPPEDASAPAQ